MTVEDLIALLRQMPPEAEVVMWGHDDCWGGAIETVKYEVMIPQHAPGRGVVTLLGERLNS